MARPKKIVDGKELYNIPDMAAKIDKYIDEWLRKGNNPCAQGVLLAVWVEL